MHLLSAFSSFFVFIFRISTPKRNNQILTDGTLRITREIYLGNAENGLKNQQELSKRSIFTQSGGNSRIDECFNWKK